MNKFLLISVVAAFILLGCREPSSVNDNGKEENGNTDETEQDDYVYRLTPSEIILVVEEDKEVKLNYHPKAPAPNDKIGVVISNVSVNDTFWHMHDTSIGQWGVDDGEDVYYMFNGIRFPEGGTKGTTTFWIIDKTDNDKQISNTLTVTIK